jgi:hypothetical protein
MSSIRFTLAVTAALLASALGCSGAQAYRLNPGDTPERYRLACTGSFSNCRMEAKKQCGDEFHVISESSNKPAARPVQSSGVSSTAPSQGVVDWRGEWVVACGKYRPPVRLVRPPSLAPEPQSSQPLQASPSQGASGTPSVGSAPRPERVCVPGVTQACLGPGACSGAQACVPEGSGYGACDCGPAANPGGTSPSPTSSPAGSGPAGSGPAGSGPAGSGPAGSGPAGSGPAGSGSAPTSAPATTPRKP